MYKRQIEKTRSECLKIANELGLEEPVKDMLDVRDILFRLEPPCESAEEMFELSLIHIFTRQTAARRLRSL